jgi:hypothetical protein
MFEQLKPKISARAVRLLRSPLPRRLVLQRKLSTTVEFGHLAAQIVALIFAILQSIEFSIRQPGLYNLAWRGGSLGKFPSLLFVYEGSGR